MGRIDQEISGTFRTEAGARHFATVRSYIETGRKHGENHIHLLVQLFNGTPWTIPQRPPAPEESPDCGRLPRAKPT